MPISGSSFGVRRGAFLGAGLAAGALQVFSPFVRTARAANSVATGLDNPLTGPYAALGKNELIGCQLAIDAVNAKGGILGRPVTIHRAPTPARRC
jgi:branched-chain amino acid transport system substrate-binding protein